MVKIIKLKTSIGEMIGIIVDENGFLANQVFEGHFEVKRRIAYQTGVESMVKMDQFPESKYTDLGQT